MKIKANWITCIIMVFAVLAVGFSGCVDKQSTEKTKSTETAQSSVKLPSQYILLNRSAELMDYIGDYTKAASGKTFLVIEMTLENHGYKTFSINPNYFTVVIDSVAYPYDSATFLTPSPLTSVALLDGGKASGYLVFQIPDGKTEYSLVYVGQGDYELIYGKLPTAKTAQESKPKVPSRNVTFSLDGKLYTFTGDDYSSRVDTSKPGYVTQITSAKPASIEVNIKTIIDESLKPANKEKAIQEATDAYIDSIKKHASGATIDEKPAYEATLANGDKVTVRQFRDVPFYPDRRINLFSYMPDDKTIVTVSSSENNQEFAEVIKTLNIGELQNLQ